MPAAPALAMVASAASAAVAIKQLVTRPGTGGGGGGGGYYYRPNPAEEKFYQLQALNAEQAAVAQTQALVDEANHAFIAQQDGKSWLFYGATSLILLFVGLFLRKHPL